MVKSVSLKRKNQPEFIVLTSTQALSKYRGLANVCCGITFFGIPSSFYVKQAKLIEPKQRRITVRVSCLILNSFRLYSINCV